MIIIEKTEIEKLEEFLRENFRLDQRIEAIEKKKLYSLEIELTRRCNLECIYCYNSSSKNPGLPDFDFNLLKRVLREAYDYGIRSITYLGGEPTLHPEINEIIKFTKDIGMEEVVLYTNGTVMNERLLESINSHINAVVIHIDSINPDIFAKVHNIEKDASLKYFESILQNIHLVKSSGYDSKRLRHCLTLFRPTYKTLEKTLRWAIHDELMLTSIFIPTVAVGRGAGVSSSEKLTIDEIKWAYEMRANIEQKPELLLLGPSEYCKQYQMSMCYISVNAQIYPYAAMGTSYGDLISEKFGYIMDDYFDELSFINCTHCKCCASSDYCFGTIAAIYNNINNDPICWHYSMRSNKW